jgi:molecular chaperone DnaK (HSP70)
MSERFVVGIDLGTTHTVVAHVDLGPPSSSSATGTVVDDPVPQTTAPGEVAALAQLPSAVYLASPDEQPPSAARLPWNEKPEKPTFVGAFARSQGARVPGRLVVSAKSWLCVSGVDRTSPILPWTAVEGVQKLSPVDVQALLLAHVKGAWNHAHEDAPLERQEVVVTVPASFDEVARELTLQAAHKAGLAHVRLLEEPQAALYAWLHDHAKSLKHDLEGIKLVLVVDVGGGTTDLTLVGVESSDSGPPRLDRIAVGEHLMLGGDNMDITLARAVEKDLTGTIGGLDAATWGALVESARQAKEALLADGGAGGGAAEHGVSLVSRGSKLVGGTRTRAVKRAEVEALLLDGFFPKIAAGDVPGRRARTALTELGLPFAQDPAVTRHVLGFLHRHKDAAAHAGGRVAGELARPDAILLNGGVFRSPVIRKRFLEVVASWMGGEVPLLEPVDASSEKGAKALDLAVARGAAYSGLVRRGRGLRIGGGSARAYFVGVGDGGEQRALCVVPRGMHEGERIAVDRGFRLVLDRPVGFPLYTSTSSPAKAGEVVPVTDDLEALPPLSAVLQSEPEVPVRVEALFSEVGTLELSLKMTEEALRRFSLQFSTRQSTDASVPSDKASPPGQVPKAEGLPKRMEEGRDLVLAFYGNKSKDVDKARVKDLRRDLEKIFGLRETWPTGLGREIAGALLGGAKNRRRTAEHERVFFQLVGFGLRPGFGAPFDDWRIEQLWPLWKDGVQYVNEKPTWASWWIMWRRVAGGLSAERQRDVGAYLKPWVLEQGTGKKGTGPTPHGQDEMIRLLASLERLSSSDKVEIGEFVWKKIGRGGVSTYWPLGRLGARHLLAGSAHDVVPKDVAEKWADKILNADLKTAEGASFALAQICRVTGDRARDLDEALRKRAAERLEKAGGSHAQLARMVRERVEWTVEDEAQAFGEALPPGLRI